MKSATYLIISIVAFGLALIVGHFAGPWVLNLIIFVLGAIGGVGLLLHVAGDSHGF